MSSHPSYLGRMAPSAVGWYQKRPCVKLRLHDKNLKVYELPLNYVQGVLKNLTYL